jgi:hypothetical protein
MRPSRWPGMPTVRDRRGSTMDRAREESDLIARWDDLTQAERLALWPTLAPSDRLALADAFGKSVASGGPSC